MTTTSALSLTESLASSSSNSILTVTITRDDVTASSTVSSESVLITDSPPTTVSSDLTLVYVFTKSATDESSSSGSSSSSKPSGLSPGVIAGIVIGSIILLIVLVLLVFCTSRRFARKKRQEEASLHPSAQHRMSRAAPSKSSYHAARSLRTPSTMYSPKSPPQELATHFNRLEVDGRGKPVEVLGSYIHPAELHAGSTTDLVAQVWRGASPPPPRKDEVGVIYIRPARRGDDITSDAGSAVCLSPPGTWETESWGASVSGHSNIVSGPASRATPSKASSRDTLGYSTHTKE